MQEGFFTEIAQFVRFSAADGEALQAFRPHVSPHYIDIVERFYQRIQEHPAAAGVLRSEAQTERLKLTLRGWLDELLSGPWDDEYCEKRARIGRMHVKVGLEQRYMSTSMAVIRAELVALANELYLNDAERRDLLVRAIGRVLDMDLTIMLESYREDSLSVVRRVEQMEHAEVEHQLRVSEARYESVIETAEVLIIAISRNDKLLMFNRKAEEILEYKRSDLLGESLFDTVCNGGDGQRVRDAINRVFAGEMVPPFECRLISRRGIEYWIRWHVTELAHAEEVVACAIGVDVTDERNLQLRTQQAEKLATLGALAAGLAHEIRNPLNSAQLQLMLVERRVGRLKVQNGVSEALAAAKTVRSELHRLAGLVEDFLAFARPRALRIESADLGATVQGVVELLSPDAGAKGVGIALDYKHTTVACYDAERIKQVIHNLIRNAVDAAGKDGDVAISVERDSTRAIVSIADSGPGIPENIDIFEPFATTKTSGTGLGLPIVKRIIDDHGGEIQVSRDSGRTVFRVELPLDGPRSS